MALVVLIGGARSGKSQLAVRLASARREPVVFIATAEARDAEMAERIARHQTTRPPEWTTVEEPLRLRDALDGAPADVAARRRGLTIAVSNEVGLGVVPAAPLGRTYRDVLGSVNGVWAERAAQAVFVVAGQVQRLERPESFLDQLDA